MATMTGTPTALFAGTPTGLIASTPTGLLGGGPAVVAGALAGALLAIAAREAVLASPAAAAWVRQALEPLRRAGREGYVPSTRERRRLAALGAAAAIFTGWLVGGVGVALPLSVAGPGLAAWAISSRRRRYRASVERSLPEVATAIADSLAAGRSLRASLPAAAAYLDGPPAAELARLGAELDLGAGTAEAVAAWRARMRSARVDAFAAALLSQRLAGGDLAGLLRRFAVGAAERDRVAEDARSATAQARFTGLLVVAMPSGGALFAELVQPGFLAKLLDSPAATILLALAAGLQVIGFVAIRRLSRVVG
jgi:tight adherence protein B